MRNGVARSQEAENLKHFDSQIPQKCIVSSCKNNSVSAKSVKNFRLRRGANNSAKLNMFYDILPPILMYVIDGKKWTIEILSKVLNLGSGKST